jgi:importin-9
MRALFCDDANAVHGSLRVLVEFVDQVSEEQLPQVLPMLLPKLAQIVMDPSRDMRTRGRAIEIFTTFAETIANFGHNDPRLLKIHLAPILGDWMALLGSVLADPASDIGFKTAAVNACTVLLRALPKKCSKLMPTILPAVWSLLTSGATVYAALILTGVDQAPADIDEDGELMSFESLAL